MSYHHGNLRESLLDEAEKVIEEQGLASIKMSVLAKRLGVSHNAPSRHFKDWNELICALAARALMGIKNYVAALPELASDDPVRKLSTYLKGYVRYALDYPSHFAVLTYPDLPKITDAEFTLSHREFVNKVVACIEEASEVGLIEQDNATQIGILCLSMCIGLSQMSLYAMHSGMASKSVSIHSAEAAIDTQLSLILSDTYQGNTIYDPS